VEKSLSQISTVNPATGEEITKFSTMDKNQVFDFLNLKKNDKSKKAYAKKVDEIKKDMQQIF